MHLTDRCRFLNCSVRMGGGGVERYVMNSQPTSRGSGGGGERYVMDDFFGPKKSLDFQGPPHQTALVIDFPKSKSICPAPYKQQVH
jgi:hypothetical protein